MANKKAPKGKVYLCMACAKRSRDLYGNQPIDHGWDESCVLNAALVSEELARQMRNDYLGQQDDDGPKAS